MFASSRVTPAFQATIADAFRAKIQAIGQQYIAANSTSVSSSVRSLLQIAEKLANYAPRKNESSLPDHQAFLLNCYFELPQFDNGLATLMGELYWQQFGNHITRTVLIERLSTQVIQTIGTDYLLTHSKAEERAQANQLVSCIITHPMTGELIFKPCPNDMWSFLLKIYATLHDATGFLATRIEALVTNVMQVRFDKIDSNAQPLTLNQIANQVKEKIQPILTAAVTATSFKEQIKALGNAYLTHHPENLFNLFSDISALNEIAKLLRDYSPTSEDATAIQAHTNFFINCYFSLPNYTNDLAAMMREVYSNQFGKNLTGSHLIQALRVETVQAIGKRYLANFPEQTLSHEHQSQAALLVQCRILNSDRKEVISNPSPAELWLFLLAVYGKLTKHTGIIANRIEAMITNTFDNILFEKVIVAGHTILPLPPSTIAAQVKKDISAELAKASTVIELREIFQREPQTEQEEKYASPAPK